MNVELGGANINTAIIRLGNVSIPVGVEGQPNDTGILSAVCATDYDGQLVWLPILLENETILAHILTGMEKPDYDAMPVATELTKDQKTMICTLVDKYKIPWGLSIYMCLNKGGLDLANISQPNEETVSPAMLTICGAPNIGKSSVLATTMENTDTDIWLIDVDLWAAEGTRALDYLNIARGADPTDKFDEIGQKVEEMVQQGLSSAKGPKSTLREVLDDLCDRLLSSGDRPDIILLDSAGFQNNRAVEIQDLVPYFCYQPREIKGIGKMATYLQVLRAIETLLVNGKAMEQAILDCVR